MVQASELSGFATNISCLNVQYSLTNDKEEYITNGLGAILQNASITFCGIYIYEFKREFKKNIALRHRYVTQRKHDEKVL